MPHPVDMSGHEMATEPVGKSQRSLEVDMLPRREATERGSCERFGTELEGELVVIDLDDRQAAAIHANAVAEGCVG